MLSGGLVWNWVHTGEEIIWPKAFLSCNFGNGHDNRYREHISLKWGWKWGSAFGRIKIYVDNNKYNQIGYDKNYDICKKETSYTHHLWILRKHNVELTKKRVLGGFYQEKPWNQSTTGFKTEKVDFTNILSNDGICEIEIAQFRVSFWFHEK